MNRYNAKNGKISKFSEKPKTQQPKAYSQKPVPMKKEVGDIWVLAVFFLLYLESRDTDFLIILAVLAFYMFDLGDVVKKLGNAM